MFNLPYKTHTRFLDHITNMKHISISLKLRFLNFIDKLFNSDNTLVKNMLYYSVSNNCSPTGCNLSRILCEFEICSPSNFCKYRSSACKMLLAKYFKNYMLNSEEMVYCSVVKELSNCIQGVCICGLNNDECRFIIENVTTYADL